MKIIVPKASMILTFLKNCGLKTAKFAYNNYNLNRQSSLTKSLGYQFEGGTLVWKKIIFYLFIYLFIFLRGGEGGNYHSKCLATIKHPLSFSAHLKLRLSLKF